MRNLFIIFTLLFVFATAQAVSVNEMQYCESDLLGHKVKVKVPYQELEGVVLECHKHGIVIKDSLFFHYSKSYVPFYNIRYIGLKKDD